MTGFSNVLIMGYGKSGKAVEQFLLNKKIKFQIFDKNVKKTGYFINKLNKKLIKNFDLVVISPGISIYDRFVQYAVKNKIDVVSELEFGFNFLSKNTKLIAVTGTNGKTTTTALLNECIKASGKTSEAVGNIGEPLTNFCDKGYDYLVCEVSSFQLEAVENFRPDIAIILNIAEDHTDRHLTFENYINAKFELLKNEPELVILNLDDAIICEKSKALNLKKKHFSLCLKKADVYINNNGNIVLHKNKVKKEIYRVENIKLPPVFIPDILAILLVLEELEIGCGVLFDRIDMCDKMSHKCELLPNTDNKMFINDSKATNIHSMMSELETCKKPTILLLGGTDKRLNFDVFFDKITTYNLKKIICFGEVKNRVFKSAKKYKFEKVVKVSHLKDAVEYAIKIAEENDIVLFSPACSSFDEFSGYKERGEYFKKLVYEHLGGSKDEKK